MESPRFSLCSVKIKDGDGSAESGAETGAGNTDEIRGTNARTAGHAGECRPRGCDGAVSEVW